jgi:hypothetical protein
VVKKGYFRKDCKLQDTNQEKPRIDVPKSSKYHGNLGEEGKSFEDGEVMSVISYEKLKHHWILHTATTFYMAPNIDYFYTYRPCSGVSIWN